jgi:sodium transport system permease protein
MVPVTGVALLMQRLLNSTELEQSWFYIVSVMAPIALYSWLALRWAIDQFQREEVLFREAERIDVKLWLRRLFRHKETRPTTAQAMFCFGLLLVLRGVSANLGHEVPLLVRSFVLVAAFMVGPPVFMALLLTTRPRQVLAVHRPAWPYVVAAVLLIPLIERMVALVQRFPNVLELLRQQQTLVEEAYAADLEPIWSWSVYVVALAIVMAAGQEIAFRGFIFAGLLMRMRPWPAILVSSFLFAAFHANVFLMPPLFLMGVLLGVLALRSGSLYPGMILHASCYVVLFGSERFGGDTSDTVAATRETMYNVGAALSTIAAAALLWWQNRRSGLGLVAALLALPQPVIPPTEGDPA